MDNTTKFTGKADKYAASRPSYPNKMVKSFYDCFNFNTSSVVADIGSGTGILTKELLAEGYFVYAVEPNENMRHFAEKDLSSFKNFISVNATAESTTLSDSSVDFITVAQAFHWFDTEKFKAECKRILKQNGKIFLIWNNRDSNSPINKDLFDINKQFCKAFTGFSGGTHNNDDKIKLFFDNCYQIEYFENPIFYDKESFVNRALSSSYALSPLDNNYSDYVKALNDLFDKYAQNELVKVTNNTKMYYNI